MLRKLIKQIDASKVSRPIKPKDVSVSNRDLLKDQRDTSSIVTHDWLWPSVGTFLRPKDILITETGTSRPV